MSSSTKRTLQRTKRFTRDLKKLPKDAQRDAFSKAAKLTADIFDPTLNVRKMAGFDDTFRVVVLKDYQMIFSFDSENVYLLRINHRKDIYKKLEL